MVTHRIDQSAVIAALRGAAAAEVLPPSVASKALAPRGRFAEAIGKSVLCITPSARGLRWWSATTAPS